MGSFLCSPDKNQTYCIYDAPCPEAVRSAAKRSNLPVKRMMEFSALDPWAGGSRPICTCRPLVGKETAQTSALEYPKPKPGSLQNGPIRHAELTASASDERRNALVPCELSEMKIAAKFALRQSHQSVAPSSNVNRPTR